MILRGFMLVLTTLTLYVIYPSYLVAKDESTAENATVTESSRKRFKFFSEEFRKMLVEEFSGKSLPPLIIQKPDGWISARNLKVYEFVPPTVYFKPIVGGHIRLEGQGGLVGIRGEWEANLTSWFFFIPRSSYGSFTMRTRNINFRVELMFFNNAHADGTQLRLLNCDVWMNGEDVMWDVDTSLSGFFFNTKHPIAVETITDQYCILLMNTIEKRIKVQTGTPLAKDIFIQYDDE